MSQDPYSLQYGPAEGPLGQQLSPAQRQELTELVDWNQDVFSSEPGHTNLAQHHIITEPGKKQQTTDSPSKQRWLLILQALNGEFSLRTSVAVRKLRAMRNWLLSTFI
ncbi:unnamed protein product [Lota lota]